MYKFVRLTTRIFAFIVGPSKIFNEKRNLVILHEDNDIARETEALLNE